VKTLITLAVGAAIGYWAVTRAAPFVQAKFEAFDLDAVWDVWDHEEWM
jgi:hypothetical protein